MAIGTELTPPTMDLDGAEGRTRLDLSNPQNFGRACQYARDRLFGREFTDRLAHRALWEDPFNIGELNYEYCANKQLVIFAVRVNGNNYEHAEGSLQLNKEIAKTAAVSQLRFGSGISDRLRSRLIDLGEEPFLSAIESLSPEEIASDEETWKKRGLACLFGREQFQHDKEVALASTNTHPIDTFRRLIEIGSPLVDDEDVILRTANGPSANRALAACGPGADRASIIAKIREELIETIERATQPGFVPEKRAPILDLNVEHHVRAKGGLDSMLSQSPILADILSSIEEARHVRAYLSADGSPILRLNIEQRNPAARSQVSTLSQNPMLEEAQRSRAQQNADGLLTYALLDEYYATMGNANQSRI